eukprot:5864675-Prymnesium_polylepis.1
MEPVGVHARRRSQPGGAMKWPHSNRRKNDPLHFRGPGASSVAAARGAFKWQWKGFGIMSSRRPVVVAHNRDEQCKGMCIAVRSAWAFKGWWSSWLEIGLRSVNP